MNVPRWVWIAAGFLGWAAWKNAQPTHTPTPTPTPKLPAYWAGSPGEYVWWPAGGDVEDLHGPFDSFADLRADAWANGYLVEDNR